LRATRIKASARKAIGADGANTGTGDADLGNQSKSELTGE
jgi:hypothetical protein